MLSQDYTEANFDGLVGPSHNYSGLSTGNIASISFEGQISNPKEAALQGLAKAEYLIERGLTQGIILPQERPNFQFLRQHGFRGSDSEIIDKAIKQSPRLFSIAISASSMWTANAATVVPSCDSDDRKLHLIVANLYTKAHRTQEATWTYQYLKKIFAADCFSVHSALTGGDAFSDEGAANHTRICAEYSSAGLHIFTYGRSSVVKLPEPQKFVARQTLEACESVARLGSIQSRSVFVQQNPEAIDAGVFHNDVISVGNENVFFCHEKAFTPQSKEELQAFLSQQLAGHHWTEVKESHVSLVKSVSSYLFNSQLLRDPQTGKMFLLCPQECSEDSGVKSYLDELVKSHPLITSWTSLDLRQSMRNGGGPACLRLRVPLSSLELSSVHPEALLNKDRIAALRGVIKKYYRDSLSFNDFRDPQLLKEIRSALDEFTQILRLGSLYDFQK